ncbi:hypothetical protein AAF712_010983 [Marasmius tenuissimus]|uniref:F-box domain-containing protein n=1 Tax=Marasmius tenuissimus TaxID=585030 RepID=A0ABR2ZKP4_9AGAR
MLCVDADIDMRSILDDSYQNDDYPSVTLDTTKSPWVLSQVSRRWRNLALSLPWLWSSFDINWHEGFNRQSDLSFIETRLSLQLERCCDQPLSVSWYHDSCDTAILQKICSKAIQWTHVTIRVRKASFESLLNFHGKFSNITSLHLRFEVGEPGEWEEQSLWQMKYGYLAGIFRNAKKLRRMTISGDYAVMPHIIPEIPWRQIEHFSAINIATNRRLTESFYGVLPLMQCLEICHLSVPWYSGEVLWNTFTTLPRLHSLVIELEEYLEGLGSLSGFLITPSLKAVTFEDRFPSSFEPLQHLIDRSSCHLEYLCFDTLYRPVHIEALVDFLRSYQASSVHVLEISWPVLASEGFLEAFHFSPTDTSRRVHLVPHLRTLHVVDEENSGRLQLADLDLGPRLVDALASRRKISNLSPGRVSRLETLTIRGNGNHILLDGPDTSVRFEGLCREGLSYTRMFCW